MGKRKIIVTENAINNIAEISWFIEGKGMLATSEKYIQNIFKQIEKLSNDTLNHSFCRDKTRNQLGQKCINLKKKYTIVFLETDFEIIILEIIPSKMIK